MLPPLLASHLNPEKLAQMSFSKRFFLKNKLYDDKRAQAMIKELNYLKENSISKDMSEVIQNALRQT